MISYSNLNRRAYLRNNIYDFPILGLTGMHLDDLSTRFYKALPDRHASRLVEHRPGMARHLLRGYSASIQN